MSGRYDTNDALPGVRGTNLGEWTSTVTRHGTRYYVNRQLDIVSWSDPRKGESQFISNLPTQLVDFELPAFTEYDAESYFMGDEKDRLGRNVTIIDNVDNEDSNAERRRFTQAFGGRGFHVNESKVRMDSVTMMNTLEELARANLKRHSCSVLIVFGMQSEKSRDLIQCSDGKYIDVEDIVEPFRGAKYLLGKPKLFIFRSFSFEASIETDHPPETGVQESAVGGRRLRIPLWADALCMFCPTTNGTDKHDKHAFVEKFCDEIDNSKGRKDIVDAIRQANLVALAEWKARHLNRALKVASVEFTLTKKWHLPSLVST